jgi:hypothetical protein
VFDIANFAADQALATFPVMEILSRFSASRAFTTFPSMPKQTLDAHVFLLTSYAVLIKNQNILLTA